MKIISNILLAAAAVLSMAVLSGCADDRYDGPRTGDGDLTISFVADDLVPGELKTRAGGTRVAKDNEEMEVRTLHVFLFDQNGDYLLPKDGDQYRYQGYTYVPGTSMLRIDKTGFLNEDLARHAIVCVAANMEDGTFNVPAGADHPVEIGNLTDFQNYYYKPSGYSGMLFNLPPEGMPMVGVQRDVNLVESSGVIEIEMQALMARIDVDLSIDSDDSDTELPSILLKSVTMHNMAQGAGFSAPAGETPAEIGLKNSEPESPGGTSVIYNGQQSKNLSFYVFENLRNDNGTPESEVYPQDETFREEYKQRYKPLFAKPEATYARFDCLFTSYNGLTYNVTYDLYFGANSTKDFRVRRNSIYTNNVTIKGLVNVGESPDKVIFDYRVNVNTETNAYFVSALRERQLDAHFNVFPMDVYVMEEGCKVRIEIVDPEVNSWIRMEKIPSAQMAAGAYKAGTGKRDYFTTDLVTNTLAANTSYDMENRDRVYFYVDEFLSTREMRSVIVRISLIGPDGAVRESNDVEFDQYGLLPVTVGDYNDGYPGDGATIYIERFEEYLNFYDPLEEYASDFVFDGLPWGASGQTIGGECYNNYYNGISFTQRIVNAVGDRPSLNVAPTTAAGYCWNKNKRSDDNGNINDPHWFLPGITQLESCLTQHYGEFPEFRGNYYWASAAAKTYFSLVWFEWVEDVNGLNSSVDEKNTYARSTAVIGFDSSGKAEYAPSNRTDTNPGLGTDYRWDNYEDGNGGRALRTTSLRIRACYAGPVDQ